VLEDGNDRGGRDGHQLGLEGNQWSCDWLVLSVAVSVNTKLLRDLLAHSHWCPLVDLMADLLRNILADLKRLLSTLLLRDVMTNFSRDINTDLMKR